MPRFSNRNLANMAGYRESGMLESQSEHHSPRYIPVIVDEVAFENLDLNDADEEKEAFDVEQEISIGDEDPLGDEGHQAIAGPPRKQPPWIRYPRAILLAFIPSFFHPSNPNEPPKRLHPTAWLDGVRGVAAFLVVCHHWSLVTFSMRIHKGYGSDAQPLLIQLPIVRLLVSGYWAVCVFFVISGFALSYKPMKLLSQKRPADFATAAASATFRRFIRIFGPPAVTTFFVALMVYNGWFESQGNTAAGTPRVKPPRGETLSDQLWHWLTSTMGFADPLSRNPRRGDSYVYDPVLWTIPIEFDCSLVVFLTHVAFSRLHSRMRLFFHVFVTGYALYFARWEFFLFLAGLLCADIHFHLQPDSEDTPREGGRGWETLPLWSKPWRRDSFTRLQYAISSSATFTRLKQSLPWRRDSFSRFQSAVFRTSVPAFPVLKASLGIAGFLASLWFLSYPHLTNDAANTPGFRTLAASAPSQYRNADLFWVPLGAVILVFAVDRTPLLQRLFNNRCTQYLGCISFAMYLVHGTLIWVCGWHLIAFFMPLTGSETYVQHGLGVGLSSLLFFPIMILVADFTQRYLDAKMVVFAAWFEKKLVGTAA